MTYQEFLAKLRETPREWDVNEKGEIRFRDRRCPLERAAEKPLGAYAATRDAILLDSREKELDVAIAADLYPRSDVDQSVRADLLSACGLSDPAPLRRQGEA